MKLRVMDSIPVRLQDGTITKAKIRRIGASDPSHKGFVMLTLDVNGQAMYTAAHEAQIAEDGYSA